MKRVIKLTHERLVELLDYDPATGALTWKVTGSNRVKIGDVAGSFHAPSGGRYVAIDGEKYMAHRLAWFYANGAWPKGDLRALDTNYSNMRLENLKDVPRVELAHLRNQPATNTSGFLGVSKSPKKGKWQSAITWNYKQISLGANFETPEEASEIYEMAATRLKDAKTDQERDSIIAGLRLAKRQRAAWKHIKRSGQPIAWASFEDFAASITEIPVQRYAMVPTDPALPIGPTNFRWSLPIDAEHNSAQDRAGYARATHKLNTEHERAKHLKKMYGAGIAYERKMLVEQNGLCAICQKPEELSRGNETRRLSLDHNHSTNALRGLLCGNCNQGLGYFCDDPAVLQNAITYLEKYKLGGPNVVPFKTDEGAG